MNKLVIVGNGFDLAHGLPTSYKDFIDDFWANLHNTFENASIRDLVCFDESHIKNLQLESVSNYDEFCNNLSSYAIEQGFFYDNTNSSLKHSHDRSTFIFKFENHFFKEINERSHIENWVDIENEYYRELKKISKQEPTQKAGRKTSTKKQQKAKNKENIRTLNEQFEEIKNLFKNYLNRCVTRNYNFTKNLIKVDHLLKYFEMRPLGLSEEYVKDNPYAQEFPKEDWKDLIQIDAEITEYRKKRDLYSLNHKTYFLNFNYTCSLDIYIRLMNGNHNLNHYGQASQIQIHGRLSNVTENTINFGFGDEMDEDYKLIENLDDNEYLKNFKSFKYSQNSNYKNLLDYIDSDKFQVYIMGHSCGLSDRTLLNTIFERKNCRSIKTFYHEWVDKEDKKHDNFTEIIQNISRHFNDKKVMRSKIVNKSLCKTLPQDIRFQKKV